LLKRYEGSFIVAYEYKSFDEFTLPLSRLEPVEGKRDSHNNRYYEPKEKKVLEGTHTRLVYLLPADRSPLEVLRNYQEEIKSKGGTILFECKAEECGGDSGRSSSGGGGDMSLAMYLFPEERITDPDFQTATVR
jgi:OmpA-OmpF porin, OOP family